MTNEEFDRRFERHVEFSLQQQAKFDAGMEELRAAQAKTERTLDRVEENIGHLAAFIHEGFGLTMNLFKDTDEKFKETDAKIQALAEEHKLTQEELRKLMGRVNRHLGEDHGLGN
jgi:hypothetical protein